MNNQIIESKRLAKTEEPDFTICLDKHIYRDGSKQFSLMMEILENGKWEIQFLHYDNENSARRMFNNIIGR